MAGIFVPQVLGQPYLSDSQKLFRAAGAPVSSARKQVIDTAVRGLKDAAAWSALDVLWMFAGAEAGIACLNWKSPGTFTAAPANSPTFTADRGYTGNGSDSRVNLTWVASTDGVQFTLNSASVWAWSLTDSSETATLTGRVVSSGTVVRPRSAGNLLVQINDAGPTSCGAVASSSGLFGATRPDSATLRGWQNGVQVGTDLSVASVSVAGSARWACGGNASQFSTRQIAMAAYGGAMTGLEDDFYTVMLAYMQAVGAV